MKKVFAFLTPVLFLMSCGGGVAKFKPAIDELSSQWDTATSAVTEFSKMVASEQSGMLDLSNNLNIEPGTMEKWDETTTSQFSRIQGTVQASSNNLASVASEVDAFVSSWTEKSNQLQALKDGLAAGKLEGDVQGQIAALTAAATDAEAKVDSWKTKFTEIQAAAANAKQMFAEFSQSAGLSDMR